MVIILLQELMNNQDYIFIFLVDVQLIQVYCRMHLYTGIVLKMGDVTKKGFFEANGRCKTINLKEEYSEGFLLPAEVFSNWIVDSVNKEIKLIAGTEFDTVSNGTNSFWVNKKYVVPSSSKQGGTNPNSKTTKQKSFKEVK